MHGRSSCQNVRQIVGHSVVCDILSYTTVTCVEPSLLWFCLTMSDISLPRWLSLYHGKWVKVGLTKGQGKKTARHVHVIHTLLAGLRPCTQRLTMLWRWGHYVSAFLRQGLTSWHERITYYQDTSFCPQFPDLNFCKPLRPVNSYSSDEDPDTFNFSCLT